MAIVLWLITRKKMRPDEFGFTTQPILEFMGVFLIATLAGTFIDQNGSMLFALLPGYPFLGHMPIIDSSVWLAIDLTLGLLLVGIVEEMVFRGYMLTMLKRYTRNPVTIILISALVFGLIHWSGGSSKVIVAAVAGAFFMFIYLRTRSLPAVMLAHFTVDFIGAWSLNPE